MGAISGLLGTAGGVNGTGFSKPVNANIVTPTSQAQANQANTGVNNSLQSSQNLVSALQGQGGATNQSQALAQGQGLYGQISGNNGVGAQANAMAGQGTLAGQLGGAGGVGAQQQALQALQGVYGSQGQTLAQLQGIASGTGPNPAQAALNQTTGQNVANQAALMAGQRGAGANVGLMARQAAQQGAATQQQAVGQGATMQAQQELNAINAMGSQQQAMGVTAQGMAGVGAGLTAQQQAALAQQFGQGATTVGQQQGQLGLNAGIAQNQVANTIGATGQNVQGNIANAGQQMGALGNYNAAGVNMQGNINNVNASLANTNMQGQQAMLGGAMSGAGSAMSAMSNGARGGMVRPMADGGDVDAPYAAPEGQGPTMNDPAPAVPAPPLAAAAPAGPTSALGQYLAGTSNTGSFLGSQSIAATPQAQTPDTTANAQIQAPPQMGYGSQQLYQGAASMTRGAEKMGLMSAAGARGGLANQGGKVDAKSPDQKATKAGNSYSNDKVPALLSEGEVVIPRSVMQSGDPVRGAADFVAKVMAKRRAS